MRSRQARKIVRMVKYTPIDRMSSTWFDRALQRMNMKNYLGNLATRLKFLKDAPSQTQG